MMVHVALMQHTAVPAKPHTPPPCWIRLAFRWCAAMRQRCWRLAGPAESGYKQANLGEESSFYYNQELGRWVERGKEDAVAAEPSGPPPKGPSRPPPAAPSSPPASLPPAGPRSGAPPGGAGVHSRYAPPPAFAAPPAAGTQHGPVALAPAAPAHPGRPARLVPGAGSATQAHTAGTVQMQSGDDGDSKWAHRRGDSEWAQGHDDSAFEDVPLE